jgi:hypothetical protein
VRTFVFSILLSLSILLCGVSADAQQKVVGSKQKRKQQQKQQQQKQEEQQKQIEQVAGGMADRLNRELPWQLSLLGKMLASQAPKEIPEIPPYDSRVASATPLNKAANKEVEPPVENRAEMRQAAGETLQSEARVANVVPVKNDREQSVDSQSVIPLMSNQGLTEPK